MVFLRGFIWCLAKKKKEKRKELCNRSKRSSEWREEPGRPDCPSVARFCGRGHTPAPRLWRATPLVVGKSQESNQSWIFRRKSLLDAFRNEFQNYKSEYFPFWFCSLTSNCVSKVLIVDLIHEGQFRSLILAFFFTSNGSAMFLPVSRSHEVVPEQLIGSTSSRLTHLCAACLPEPELTPLTPTQCL